MTKTELMETYTAEQLAEMVVKKDIALEQLAETHAKAVGDAYRKNQILEENNGRLQSKLDTYNNYLLRKATKEAKEMIDHNHFTGVRIVTQEQWNNRGEKSMNISDIQKCQEEYEKLLKENPLEGVKDKICKDILEQKNNAMAMEFTRIICDLLKRYGVYVHCTETKFGEKITTNSIEEQYGIVFDSMDFSQHDKEFADRIEELKKQLDRSQTTINQIDYILEKLFGVRHDTAGKPDEFEKVLKQKAESYNTIADYLCDEPISVAQTLISAKRSYELSAEEKQRSGLEKGYYHIFEVSELRQIAEHLLIYCNHNKEEEE